MKVNVVWGAPASGKSTFAKDNRSNNSLVFDFDEMMAALSGLPMHKKNNHIIPYIEDTRSSVIERLKEESKLRDVWIIYTWVDDSVKRNFDGLDAQYYLMETDIDECLKRAEESGRPEGTEQVINDWFQKYEKEYGGMRKMAMDKDIRFVPVEIRAEGEEDKKASGIGILYDQWSEIYPGFKERILTGAVERSKVVKSFVNHDPNQVLCTTDSNPALELRDTDKGLEYVSPIPPTSYGKDLEINLDRGNIKGSSFAFRVAKDGQKNWDEKGIYYREISKLTLFEVGPVTDPAYIKTSANLRTAEELFIEMRSASRELADKEAQAATSRELEERERELQLIEKGV